jgi:hypothetical protein
MYEVCAEKSAILHIIFKSVLIYDGLPWTELQRLTFHGLRRLRDRTANMSLERIFLLLVCIRNVRLLNT